MKQKTDAMKWEAKLHGASDKDSKTIDLSNIQSDDEWNKKAAQVSGLFGFGTGVSVGA